MPLVHPCGHALVSVEWSIIWVASTVESAFSDTQLASNRTNRLGPANPFVIRNSVAEIRLICSLYAMKFQCFVAIGTNKIVRYIRKCVVNDQGARALLVYLIHQ